MAATARPGPFSAKPTEQLLESADASKLHRSVGVLDLTALGTLFAFLLVNFGVVVLRRTKPDLERGFRVPFVPVFPIIGGLLCIYLMTKLEAETWLRFGGWLVAGLLIYGLYGYRHSQLRNPS